MVANINSGGGAPLNPNNGPDGADDTRALSPNDKVELAKKYGVSPDQLGKTPKDSSRDIALPQSRNTSEISDEEARNTLRRYFEIIDQHTTAEIKEKIATSKLNLEQVERRYKGDSALKEALGSREYYALALLGYSFPTTKEFIDSVFAAQRGEYVNLQKLFIPEGRYENLNLSGLDLTLSKFYRTNFSRNCKFDMANFKYCDFIDRCIFKGQSMQAVNMRGATVSDYAEFQKTNCNAIQLDQAIKTLKNQNSDLYTGPNVDILERLSENSQTKSCVIKDLKIPLDPYDINTFIAIFDALGIDDNQVSIAKAKTAEFEIPRNKVNLSLKGFSFKDLKNKIRAVGDYKVNLDLSNVNFTIDGIEIDTRKRELRIKNFNVDNSKYSLSKLVEKLKILAQKDEIAPITKQIEIQSDFRDSELRGKFVETELKKANFTGAILNEALFTGANISEANLTKAEINQTDFQSCIANNSIFNHSRGASPIFKKAQLENASFKRVEYLHPIFNEASLKSSKFDYSKLTEADFGQIDRDLEDSESQTSEVTNLEKASFFKTKTKLANFSEANLTGVSFKETQQLNPNFQAANLTRAKFNGAALMMPDFRRINSFTNTQFLEHCGLISPKWPGGAPNMSKAGLKPGINYDRTTFECKTLKEYKKHIAQIPRR